MIPTPRTILVFVLQFAPLFLLFLWLYSLVLPLYEPLALGAANAVTLRLEPRTEMTAAEEGGWQAHVFTAGEGLRRLRGWSPSTAHLIFLNLFTLPALLLATPAPWRSRAARLAAALPLMFVCHLAAIVVLSRGTWALQQHPGQLKWMWALSASYTSGQLTAAGLWLMLTWRFWFRRAEAGGGAMRGGPGSGRMDRTAGSPVEEG